MSVSRASLKKFFTEQNWLRGVSYYEMEHVDKLQTTNDTTISAVVHGSRTDPYQVALQIFPSNQSDTITKLMGVCTCPVGGNCKHVVATLLAWIDERKDHKPKISQLPSTSANLKTKKQVLPTPLANWVAAVEQGQNPALSIDPSNPHNAYGYPNRVRFRLAYALIQVDNALRVALFKASVQDPASLLDRDTMAPYPIGPMLRSGYTPPLFILPEDFSYLGGLLIRAAMADHPYSVTPHSVFRHFSGDEASLLKALCDTGRFLANYKDHTSTITWAAEETRAPQLVWTLMEGGQQRLTITTQGQDQTQAPVLTFGDQAFWYDPKRRMLGALSAPLPPKTLKLVETAPLVEASTVEMIAAHLPEKLGDMPLPKPQTIKTQRRTPTERKPHLHVFTAKARLQGDYWGRYDDIAVLKLYYLYDGHSVSTIDSGDTLEIVIDDANILVLARDMSWERQVADFLELSGLDTLEETLEAYQFEDETIPFDFSMDTMLGGVDPAVFTFKIAPQLAAKGWKISFAPNWPYQLNPADAQLVISTGKKKQADSQAWGGAGWFNFGFAIEIDGHQYNIAMLVESFISALSSFESGMIDDWDWDEDDDDWDEGDWDEDEELDLSSATPDKTPISFDAFKQALTDSPQFIQLPDESFAKVDLSPAADFLYAFWLDHLGGNTLHPAESLHFKNALEALEGSGVRFSDSAGILPLAKKLESLRDPAELAAPKALNATLRDYQAFGAAWLHALLQSDFGGVLADDMGLGKTIQVLACLLRTQQEKEEDQPHKPWLLIVPTSLIYSWQQQTENFAPHLSMLVYQGPDRHQLIPDFPQADIVLSTYPLLARDLETLKDQDWQVIVLDEAQTLKNPTSKMAKALRELPCQGRLALTGTPLENSLQDLWTLFDWVVPGLLGDRTSFVRLFRTPIEKQGDQAAQQQLNRRLAPFLLRRTKDQVVKELPPKTEIVTYVDLGKQQQALYESVRASMDERVRATIQKRGLNASRIAILDALLKLRQCCCHPQLVKTASAKRVTESAKLERLEQLVTELLAEGRCILIFSQFVEMLTVIAQRLDALEVPYLKLTGQTKKRQEVLEAFDQGKAPVFLISLKAGGVGLTLTRADTVILYDPWWNPAVERQAMDRTHRIGQDKPVFVYRLVAKGSVEERILELQAKKQALADALFEDSGKRDSAGFIDEQTLDELFSPLR